MNVLRFALLLVLALLGLASAQNLGSSDEKLIRQRRGYRNRRDTTVKIVAQPPLLLNSSNTLPVFKKIETFRVLWIASVRRCMHGGGREKA
ncbi:unnamed protein product [Bursaphelenchus xylophilus]|uniref:(pine wood nematode) hypothetical protein n=1 Tax=Bursaphelenchus xylophilus TaxID=6326 RepID=A0A7I8XP94_BURXY|nr:unnamed protein product [Bursaphelenchus xylophilus]CAG9080893.1 unnamed protein product [Bursaphelenchus xylophilus]